MTLTAEAVAAATDAAASADSNGSLTHAVATHAAADGDDTAVVGKAPLQLELPRETEGVPASSSSLAQADSANGPLTPVFAVQHASDAGSRPASSSGTDVATAAFQPNHAASVTPTAAVAGAAASHSPSSAASAASAASADNSREEQVVALLSSKKRALLCEIGALLTLRERLHAEMESAGASGVPFDYAERFAHSPSTLRALEQAADAWREELRREQQLQEKQEQEQEEEEGDAAALTQAVADAAYRSAQISISGQVGTASPGAALVMMSPQARAAPSAHRLTLAQPRMHFTPSPARGPAPSTADQPVRTPARERLASAAAAAVAAAGSAPAATVAPRASAAPSRPHTAPSRSSFSFASPSSGAMYSPIKEHDEEEAETDADAQHGHEYEDASASFASVCALPGTGSGAAVSPIQHQDAEEEEGTTIDPRYSFGAALYNGTGIEHEESLFFDSLVLDGEEIEMQFEPAPFAQQQQQQQQQQRHDSAAHRRQEYPSRPAQVRFAAAPSAAPAFSSTARSMQQSRPQQAQQHQRPHTANAGSYQHYQQSHPEAQHRSRTAWSQPERPHTSRPYADLNGASAASNCSTPAPHAGSSTASSPAPHPSSSSSSSPNGSAPQQPQLGYLALKALAKQQAAEESLRSFRGKTLRGAVSEGLERENESLKEHYPNFQAIPQQKYEPVHGVGGHGRSPAPSSSSSSATSRHSTPGRMSMASPARARPLQNITNASSSRATHSSASKLAPPSASSNSHVTPLKERTTRDNYIRW